MGFEGIQPKKEKNGISGILKKAAVGVTLGLVTMHAVDAGANIDKKVEKIDPGKSTTLKMTAEDLAKMKESAREKDVKALAEYQEKMNRMEVGSTEIEIDAEAQKALDRVGAKITNERIRIGINDIDIKQNSKISIYCPASEYNDGGYDFIISVTNYKGEKDKSEILSRDSYRFKGKNIVKSDREDFSDQEFSQELKDELYDFAIGEIKSRLNSPIEENDFWRADLLKKAYTKIINNDEIDIKYASKGSIPAITFHTGLYYDKEKHNGEEVVFTFEIDKLK
jgi:hypothetical protein